MFEIKINGSSAVEVARKIAQYGFAKWVFLNSSHISSEKKKFYIAFNEKEKIVAKDFEKFSEKLSNDKKPFENSWFGYLGYGLKNFLENLPQDQPSYINPPDLYFVRYGVVIEFIDKQACLYCETEEDKKLAEAIISTDILLEEERQSNSPELHSNMSDDEYFAKVEEIRNAIKAGDLSQANLTRKYFGDINNIQPFSIFLQLMKKNPAEYGCYMQLDDFYILSSSPEQFLHLDADGNVCSRPIKGTKPIAENSSALKNSDKDQAENLMIVDLMRHDFSKYSEDGSVKVEKLFDVKTHANLHHMSSKILAKKKGTISTLDFVKACFPPGSMTGTPKIKAMEICSKLEKQKRGVYSGAIGYFCGDGACNLSVVIRTLLLEKQSEKSFKFELQVGGAITYDSNKNLEKEEMITKAKPIFDLLKRN